MWELPKIRAVVLALGWPKASFCVCLFLLVRGVVTFDQCLLLILCGALVHFLPARKGPDRARKQTMSRRVSKVTKLSC
jgi:hypothetical protein